MPLRLPAPQGLTDQSLWEKTRRGWFGAFQPSARWGDQTRPFSAPAGILGNNVISDPASCSPPRTVYGMLAGKASTGQTGTEMPRVMKATSPIASVFCRPCSFAIPRFVLATIDR